MIARFKFQRNVLHAQGFGHWLYIQLGSWAFRFGSHCNCGARLVWNRALPKLQWRRFK